MGFRVETPPVTPREDAPPGFETVVPMRRTTWRRAMRGDSRESKDASVERRSSAAAEKGNRVLRPAASFYAGLHAKEAKTPEEALYRKRAKALRQTIEFVLATGKPRAFVAGTKAWETKAVAAAAKAGLFTTTFRAPQQLLELSGEARVHPTHNRAMGSSDSIQWNVVGSGKGYVPRAVKISKEAPVSRRKVSKENQA